MKDFYQYGFDLTEFDDGIFEVILKALELKPTAILTKDGWCWENPDLKIITGCNPMNGLRANTLNVIANEIGYASYIGIEGNIEQVMFARDLIIKYAIFTKGHCEGRIFI